MDCLSHLPTSKIQGKRVLIRIDCDVDLKENGEVDEAFRLRCDLPTIEKLLEMGAEQVVLAGHIGRPEGKVVEELRLSPVARWFRKALKSRIKNLSPRLIDLVLKISKPEIRSPADVKTLAGRQNFEGYQIGGRIVLLENVRFDPREEENDMGLAKEYASLADIYVNEVFGVSHRKHASIEAITHLLPTYYGFNFEKEVTNLTWLKAEAPRPLVFVLGGSKKDKLDHLEFLGKWADKLLVGGRLPTLIQNSNIEYRNSKQIQNSKFQTQNNNVILAELTEDGMDINKESIGLFKAEIAKAATVVWAGPMGKYEEVGSRAGTMAIAQAVASCPGKKIAGGGDTHRIIGWLKLWDKFDFVSAGGGSMLEFLKK